MHLIETLLHRYGTILLSKPFGSGKYKDEDIQKVFTGLQYFKIPVAIFEITCRLLQSRALLVNFWRVKLWQILQKIHLIHQSFPLPKFSTICYVDNDVTVKSLEHRLIIGFIL